MKQSESDGSVGVASYPAALDWWRHLPLSHRTLINDDSSRNHSNFLVFFLSFVPCWVVGVGGEQWYEVDAGGMDAHLARLLLVLDASDAATEAFLEACRDASDAVLTQLWHLVARTCMAPFLTQTAINGSVPLPSASIRFHPLPLMGCSIRSAPIS